MASYYLAGYATPEGVSSRADVKKYQQRLGVKADGVWGPITQAAYERSRAVENPMELFNQYFSGLMSSVQTPTVSVETPNREELLADYSAAMRPGVELAIGNRRKRGEAARAEMDADAYSRGMGASTYVSSMKEREGDDVESDVAMLEAGYTAALAERVAASLEKYAALKLQAESQNANNAISAQNSAMSLAGQWYGAYLSGLGKASASGGSRSGGAKSAADPYPNRYGLSDAEYEDFVRGLTTSERNKLYYSAEEDWADCRQEILEALGPDAYAKLRGANPGASRASGGGSLGGGGLKWTASQR